MSHCVTIATQITSRTALAAACSRLGLAPPVDGVAELYDGTKAAGTLVVLPGWLYPVVVDLATGTGRFDNFEGRWGRQEELDRLCQRYASEVFYEQAYAQGHRILGEEAGVDGEILLTIEA
jgi:hypothetical protein